MLPIHFWHLLEPHHEASSRRLRSIAASQCQTLLKAAAADREERRGQRTKKEEDGASSPMTRLLPAVKKFLPKAPERMAVGIARVIEKAEREGAEFIALREKVQAESQRESSRSSLVVHREIDQAAAAWGLEHLQMYGEERRGASVSAHLVQAAAFLKGESKGGDLPRTNYLWFWMLGDLPLRCWQTLWRVTAQRMTQQQRGEIPWLEFLEFWRDLAIAELPGQFALLDAEPEGAKQQGLGRYDVEVDPGTSFTLRDGDNLFIAIEHGAYNVFPYRFLRYSTAKTPGLPPGYKVQQVCKLDKIYDPEQVAAFVAAAKTCDTAPLPTKEELEEVATNLSVSPAEVGLIWLGGLNLDGHGNNFLPAELRSALGWKLSEANAGRVSLRNLNGGVLSQLYRSVLAPGLAAPFADDRGPVLRSIENTWRAKVPKRLALDATLQKRLSALGQTSRWRRADHEALLSLAANPSKHSLLQPCETEIRPEKTGYGRTLSLAAKKKNENPVDLDLIRSIVQLVGMVHGETPAGHEARAAMPCLIQQTTKLLNDAKVLLELWRFHLYELGRKQPPKPSEWINKHLGKTKPNTKDGTICFDDGLIAAAGLDSDKQVLIGLRPAKLKDQSDVSRLRGILEIEIPAEYDGGKRQVVPLIAVIKSPGFQKLVKAVLARELPDGQWPQNPRHTAPAVMAGVQHKYKLGEEAAMLYAQLLALPEPTAANVRLWNGWTAAQWKKASADLIQRKLVLEAQRARAGRTVFLPGEWAELKSPWLPMETWKLAHLVELHLDVGEPFPAGGPMVLRPFEDLFAAAWQRIQEGDEPRYAEVKRRARKK